jgi:hypothetical protein
MSVRSIPFLAGLSNGIEKTIPIGTRYMHYKGDIYLTICISIDEETKIPYVIYTKPNLLTSDLIIWSQKVSVWREDVIYNGNIVPRFKRID